MRRAAGHAWAAMLLALLGASPVPAQDLPGRRLQVPAPPAASPEGTAGDLAGPDLSPPAPAAPPGQQAPEGGAPLRVAPPAASVDGAAQALGRAVLTVDQEAMYRQSRWGLRAQAELAAQSRQVAADNERAFADLVADEDALTAARATLSPDEFRTRAARFDERVTAVRAERQAALEALTETAERDRALFFQAAAPVLGHVMTARGALVVLDQRTVLIADERIDVTAATIAALDAELGDGRDIIAAAARAQAEGEERAAEPDGAPSPGGSAPEGSPVPGDRPVGSAEQAPDAGPPATPGVR